MSIPHLLRRPRRRDCFRIVVPPELRSEFGKREIREVIPEGESPRTFCYERAAHWRRVFDRAAPKRAARSSLLPDEIEALARATYVGLLREDEEWRATDDEDALEFQAVGNDVALDFVAEGTKEGREFVVDRA